MLPLPRRPLLLLLQERLSPPQGCTSHTLPPFHSSSSVALFTSRRRRRGGGDAAGEEEEGGLAYADVPRPGRKWERKPYLTPIKELIRRAKEERLARLENPCRVLDRAPANGLLVPDLVPLALRVFLAHQSLLRRLPRLLRHPSLSHTSVHRCRFCSEVHIGRQGHEIWTCEGPGSAARGAAHMWRRGGVREVVRFPYCYHLHDRVGKPRVGHKERFGFKRLPAVVELCIQAGLDLEDYPTKRRTRPIYSIEGRIVDFELEEEEDEAEPPPPETRPSSGGDDAIGEEEGEEELCELGAKALDSWLEMRSGANRIMEEYGVVTCGYCPEVQVGPKGHKVRMCKAAGHQFRDGLHAWQEATLDDLIGPNYVWHVRDPDAPPLANELKRFYGKAPAIVELCVQAGAPFPHQYRSMMRLDVVPPDRDECDLVA